MNHCNKSTNGHADGNDTASDGNDTTLNMVLTVMTIAKNR